MATRFYFPETEAAAVSPAIQGTYGHTNTLRRRLPTTADASTLTSTAYTPDAADHLVAGAAHHRQYVSDQIPAQTVSGTFKLQLQGLEANAGNNQVLNILIFVCSSDGTTIKETLFAQTAAATELGTALGNRSATGSLSSATLEANDRIVIQVGTSGTPSAAGGVQGHNATIRWGCNASSGDLPENETETGTTFRGWFELSGNLFSNTYNEGTTLTGTATATTEGSRAFDSSNTYTSTAAITEAAGNVVESSLSLGTTAAITEAAANILEVSNAYTSTAIATASDISANTYDESTSLTASSTFGQPLTILRHFISRVGFADPYEAINIDIKAIAIPAQVALETSASAAATATQTNVAGLDQQVTLSLTSTATITEAPSIETQNAVTLIANAVTAAAGDNAIFSAVTLSASSAALSTAGDVSGGAQTYNESVTLTAVDTLTLGNAVDFQSALSLTASAITALVTSHDANVSTTLAGTATISFATIELILQGRLNANLSNTSSGADVANGRTSVVSNTRIGANL